MKKMKYILIIAAVVIALGIIFFMVRKSAPGPGGVLDGDGMINPYAISTFSYDRGGGMVNAHCHVTLEANELTVEERIGQETTVKKYEVPDETINRIEKVLYDSGMKKGPGDFPENEYQALDAETVSVTVVYGDGAFIHFDSNQKVPDGYWEAVDETMRLLEAATDK